MDARTPEPIPPRLSVARLRELADVDELTLERLVGAGVLERRDGDEPFVAGDVYRIRLVLACEDAGMPAEAIGKAIADGRLSLGFMDLPHYRWTGFSSLTYRQVAEEFGLPLDLVLETVRSMGSIGRSADDRVREDELELVQLTRLGATMVDPDALVRTSRVYAQALQRITDAEEALFERYVLGAFLRQGLSFRQAVDAANAFGAETTALQERVLLTAYRRQQERQWTEFTVEAVESVLDEMGAIDRAERPPAFSFVDLAGYTRLTEERGDAESARVAVELASMVDAVATSARGRTVKWLGDGVMVRFRDPSDAVGATLDIVGRAPAIGLPAHAGVSAGPVVFQDGDYFGRTVNLAARVAAVAPPGETYVTDLVVRTASGFGFHEVGALDLKGFTDRVTLFAASRDAAQ